MHGRYLRQQKSMPRHSGSQLASLLAGGPGTVKRFFAISVLVVISKPKREKQDSILFGCLNTLLSPLRSENYFGLKVPVFLDLEREGKYFTQSFKELQLVITPRYFVL